MSFFRNNWETSHLQRGCVGLLVAVFLFLGIAAEAQPIAIPNHSFERPVTPYVSIAIQSWQKTPKPATYEESGGYEWTQLIGIFKNTPTNSFDHIDNCHSNQAAWVFVVPGAGLFQDYDSMDSNDPEPSHEFDVKYRMGSSYELTVGVLVGAIGTAAEMADGATFELSLYYRVNDTNRVNVAATVITKLPTVFSNSTHFLDFKVTTPPVQASDPWAGKHLGIQLLSTVDTNLPAVGYWDLDNVRLREIRPPALQQPAIANGQFRFTIESEPGGVVEVLTSLNPALENTNWTSLGLITNATGSTPFIDTSGNFEQRYYRVQQLQ